MESRMRAISIYDRYKAVVEAIEQADAKAPDCIHEEVGPDAFILVSADWVIVIDIPHPSQDAAEMRDDVVEALLIWHEQVSVAGILTHDFDDAGELVFNIACHADDGTSKGLRAGVSFSEGHLRDDLLFVPDDLIADLYGLPLEKSFRARRDPSSMNRAAGFLRGLGLDQVGPTLG